MQKQNPIDYPVQDLIRNRWSPRAFSPASVPPEVLRSLFEAARWAPSSNNEQPWAFLVARREEQESHAKLLSTLVESNRVWAQHAPVLALAVSELEFAGSGQPNRNATYDTGAALAYLTVEATARGLFVHQMAGFDPQRARELLHLPKGWEPIAAFVIGSLGDPRSLPEYLRERERKPGTRKPLSTFVLGGSWGEPAPFLET